MSGEKPRAGAGENDMNMRNRLAAVISVCGAAASECLALPIEPDSVQGLPALKHAGLREGNGCIVKTDIPPMPREEQHAIRKIPADVVRLNDRWEALPFGDRGLANNRLNLVVIGDGYLSTQQTTFNTHTTNTLNTFFAYEPYKTYKNYFQVFRVTVNSNVSGVSGDPTSNINKNTPLHMNFWCAGIERLLCININSAYQYAANSPQPFDEILALANSTKYGGAGYPGNEVGTASGGNSQAALIAIHEMGHSLGDLEDEYDYGDGTVYGGGEPFGANASIKASSQMAAAQTKWWRWLGDSTSGFDGPVSTYEGAVYAVFGVYRPSPNSMMRSLGPNFNLPSCEALISRIYGLVRPIDGPPNPATSTVLGPTSAVSILLMQTVNNPLSVQWVLDGAAIPGATSANFNVGSLNLRKGASSLSVRVVDNTPMVRDPAIRNSLLTQTLTWQLPVAPCIADLSGDRLVDDADFPAFVIQYDALACAGPDMPLGCSADFNNDGFVDDADFSILAGLYDALICP